MKISRSLRAALAAVLFSSRLFGASATPISGLPAASSVGATNLTIVVDLSEPNPNLQTKKANVSQLVDGLPAASSGAKGTMSAADKIKLDAATNSATVSTLVMRDSSGNSAFNNITVVQGTVTNPPLNANDIANKGYVDSAAAGLSVKAPCKAATTANVTLAGGAPTVVDGVTLIANDRVLVWNQTDPKENGLYYVSVLGTGANGTWLRTTDADTGAELVTGSYTFVLGGTISGNSSYVMTTAGTIVIGTSNIVWTLYTQVTNILAANIIGQLVSSQIADAAITTAKFASGITPVEILGTLPVSSNFAGRSVFLTSDSKLYRYNGSSFIASVATTDLSGTIITTQIADNSISTPKLQANSITAAKIATNTITANEIAADTITAGQIAAGAVNTSELAASAVTAAKILAGSITTTQIAASTILGANIAAGTITASNLSVSTLSAISANLGTITAGTLSAVTITSATLNTPTGNIGGFTIGLTGLSSTTGNYHQSFLAASGGVPPEFTLQYSGANFASLTETTAGGLLQIGKAGKPTNIQLTGETGVISVGGSSGTSGTLNLYNTSGTAKVAITGSDGVVTSTELISNGGDGFTPHMRDDVGGHTLSFQWDGSNLKVKIDGSVLTVTTTP